MPGGKLFVIYHMESARLAKMVGLHNLWDGDVVSKTYLGQLLA